MKLKLIKIGNSKGVVIPNRCLKEHDIHEGEIEILFKSASNNKVITIDYDKIKETVRQVIREELREATRF